MKKFVATIALLCVSNTVLAHDIYGTLRDRDGVVAPERPDTVTSFRELR